MGEHERGDSRGDGHARTDRHERTGRRYGAPRSLERQAVGPTTQACPRRRGPQVPHPPRQLELRLPLAQTLCDLLGELVVRSQDSFNIAEQLTVQSHGFHDLA